MEWLNTWRDVPPVSLQSWARVTVVFTVFLAAQDHHAPYDLDPFALAVGVELIIRILQLLTTRLNFFKGEIDDYLILAAICCTVITLAGWTVFQPPLTAMITVAVWQAGGGLCSIGLSFMPEEILRSNSTWRRYGDDAPFAMRFETLCHLLSIIVFAAIFLTLGPMIALAFATFGFLVLSFIINWTIYLIIRARYLQ
ncbi:MAG: hypothetical protein ABJD13_19555 [Paracoccaceae bacterium]